jgi:hypothetical protein
MARAVKQHKTKSAKRTSRRRTSRQSGRSSQNNPPQAASSNWLSLEDVFQRWRARLELSEEAVDEVYALLRDRETRSRKRRVNASGEETPGTLSFLNAQFWQDLAHLLVMPDADGVGDHLGTITRIMRISICRTGIGSFPCDAFCRCMMSRPCRSMMEADTAEDHNPLRAFEPRQKRSLADRPFLV